MKQFTVSSFRILLSIIVLSLNEYVGMFSVYSIMNINVNQNLIADSSDSDNFYAKTLRQSA